MQKEQIKTCLIYDKDNKEHMEVLSFLSNYHRKSYLILHFVNYCIKNLQIEESDKEDDIIKKLYSQNNSTTNNNSDVELKELNKKIDECLSILNKSEIVRFKSHESAGDEIDLLTLPDNPKTESKINDSTVLKSISGFANLL